MILLNLVLFAQSFAFETTVQRTPYIVNMSTGQVLVEAESAGTSEFQVCQTSMNGLNPLAEINNVDLLCNPVTESFRFANTDEQDLFIHQLSADIQSRLKFLKIKSILSDSFAVGSGAALGSLYGGTIALLTRPQTLGPVLFYLFGSVLVGVAIPLTQISGMTDLRINKANQLSQTLSINKSQMPTMFAEDPVFFKIYLKSVQSRVKKFLAKRETAISPKN